MHGRERPFAGIVLVLGLAAAAACSDERSTDTGVALEQLYAEAEALRESEERENSRQAAVLYGRALEQARSLENRQWEARIQQRLGWVHRKYLEEKRQAIDHYRSAQVLFAELGEIEDQANAHIQIGRLHFALGDLDQAVAEWQGALALARRAESLTGEASALGNLALASRYLGEAEQVLPVYDRIIEVYTEIGAPVELGRAFNNRSRFYQALGQPDQALTDLERALAIGREIHDPSLQAMVLTAMGQIREQQGKSAAALKVLEEALTLREQAAQRRGLAVTLRSLATVYERFGWSDRALAANRRALEIFQTLESRREVAGTLAALGRLEAAAHRPEEALGRYHRALQLFQQIGDREGEVETLLDMARTRRAQGDPAAALLLTERSLEGIEDLRDRVAGHDLRRSYFAMQQDHWDFLISLRMELHRHDPSVGHDHRALEVCERSRARSLLDLLVEDRSSLRAGVDPELLRREQELQRRIALLEMRRLRHLDRNETAEAVTATTARLEELLRQLRVVQGEIRTTGPRYAALVRPKPLTMEDLRRLLDPETVLLKFHLGEELSIAWVVTPDTVTSFELPPRADIEAAARRAYRLIEPGRRREFRAAADEALAHLSRLILVPITDIPAGRRLLIVGEGALQYVPFAALPVPGSGGPRPPPLAAEYEIVTAPSASVLARLRQQIEGRSPAPGGVAVVADPVFERHDPRLAVGGAKPAERAGAEESRFQRLTFSGQEAEAILPLVPPAERFEAQGLIATREVVMSPELGRYRIIHLATHGWIDSRRPELSRLVFSRFDPLGNSRQGFLYAHEVFGLEWPADLVVLSACSTALGQEIRGEGLVGLTQGFLYAGAAAVVVSLWQVDDRATAALMERFYRALLLDGRPPPAALRQAQLSLRRDPGRQAPYYWAGFVLQGEWRQGGTKQSRARGNPSLSEASEIHDLEKENP